MAVASKAAKRLVERGREARHSFREFCRFVGDINPQPHQEDLIEACQDIGDHPDKGQKYCLVMPPGWGKSQIVAVLWNAWMIGKYPNSHGAILAYGNKPAHARSRALRKLMASERAFHITFPDIEKDKTNWGAGEFSVDRKGKSDPHPSMLCGGIRSAVLSYRLNRLTLDDLVDKKTMDNPEMLEKAWANYIEVASTRCIEGTPIMAIGTRWGADDFISRLMARKAEGWQIIHVPARRDGETTWPKEKGGYSNEFLRLKELEDPELFIVQYQGDPEKKGIGILKKLATFKNTPDKEWIKEMDLMMAAGWDCALKDKQRNDFTVGYIGGLDPDGTVWVVDRRKDRFSSPDIIREIYDVQLEWDPFTQWVEDTAAGTPAVQTIIEESPEAPLEPVTPSSGGKRSRAHALSPAIHSGRIRFYRVGEWYSDAKFNLTRYPFILHDDDIDALWILVDGLWRTVHPTTVEQARDMAMQME
jgi:predicted phage terminase large subunit-like protein